MPLRGRFLPEAELLLSVAFVRDDGLRPAFLQRVAELGAIIGFFGENFFAFLVFSISGWAKGSHVLYRQLG